MNSIDCLRETDLFSVLIDASESKERSEAEALDFEAERQKHK